MRLILDTHVLLWALAASRVLPATASDLLLDPDNEKVVSIVSVWEIATKHPLRRAGVGALPFGAQRALELIGEAGFPLLSLEPGHIVAVEQLSRPPHPDPFDRMLVAQAMATQRRLLTHDAALAVYGSPVLVV